VNVLPVGELDDPRVAEYRSLRRVASLRRDRCFVAEGARVVVQLLMSRLRVRSLLLDARWLEELRPMLETRPETDLDVYVTTKDELQKIVGFHVHQGVMAVAEAPEPPDLLDHVRDTENALLVALAGVSNAENVGGILRTMAGFGATGLLVDAATCDPFVRRAARVSMGAAFRIPVWRAPNLPGDLARLRAERGVRVLAAHLHGETVPLDEADLSGPLVVALGSEADGLPDDVTAACDLSVEIPMSGDWSCLNVGTAGAILLWEITRRRRAAG
jgi:tRNA G18 (ribose-2'-O)-methylase SpoU